MKATNDNWERFIKLIQSSIEDESIVGLSLKNKRDKSSDLKLVNVRLVEIKNAMHLSFVYSYPTKDITKNYQIEEGIQKIVELLQNEFFQSDLITDNKIHFFNSQHKVTLKSKDKAPEQISRSHDQKKNVPLQDTSMNYLYQLGITSKEGHVIGKMRSKYNQINKYIEIVDNVISNSSLTDQFRIYDMGSGKAYLSFALYDHLKNNKQHTVELTGIELREELVASCNQIAKDNGFGSLKFETGYIGEKDLEAVDILIALHACDTATDDAIFQGIQSQASIIICSPCCHKQVRKSMEDGHTPITKHGILKERLAEMLTDTIRALLLEACGYKSKIIEFISSEHTAKNLMLIGVLDPNHPKGQILGHKLQEVKNLKEAYGITQHYLEELINARSVDH
ncbi:MAG: SAM-dependent methyltransferase [Saprospiraceae bacterium]|nr:SAM-dependent methyltransferase [Saprospiraceae bacterium]